MASNDELLLELDGPGVSPDAVDTLALLHLATAYLSLLTRLGKEHELKLTGLHVHDKCIAVASYPNSVQIAKAAAQRAARVVTGDEVAPFGSGELADEVRRALRGLPHGQTVKVILGDWIMPVENAPVFSAEDRPRERTEIRARPLRVGGAEPVARFRSASETKQFSLNVSREFARELGSNLYLEVDLEIEVYRDMFGNIESGRVLAVHTLSDGADDQDEWQAWYQENAGEWDEVEDIERELGR